MWALALWLDESQLDQVRWSSQKETILIERREDKDGPHWWVHHSSESGITEQYKAGTNGQHLLEGLAPMRALRHLSGERAQFQTLCQKDKSEAVEKKASLTLTFKAKTRASACGARATEHATGM